MKNAKLLLKSALVGIFRVFVILFSPLIIPTLKLMAITGVGTDLSIKFGVLPVRIHFYQPVPDIRELERRKVWDKVSTMGGIYFTPERYLKLIGELAQKYAGECQWPNEPSTDPRQFYLHNGSFSYGCAAPLHSLIRHNKPRQVVEIGSGNSSKVIAAAIELNALEGHETRYTIVDPYCTLDQKNLPQHTTILKQPVELMDLAFFESLEENDILFIDSSHVSKIGSDVNFEILEILPRLNTGVCIHFHDIPMPFEYSKTYATNPRFRMFWNESYLLQAFLSCNNDFQIILPMSYLQRYHLDELKKAFPYGSQTDFGWVSGSFWIKRVAKPVS